MGMKHSAKYQYHGEIDCDILSRCNDDVMVKYGYNWISIYIYTYIYNYIYIYIYIVYPYIISIK